MATKEQCSGEEQAAVEVGMAYQSAGRAWAAVRTGDMTHDQAEAAETEAMLLRDLAAEKYGWHAGPMQAEPEAEQADPEPEMEM